MKWGLLILIILLAASANAADLTFKDSETGSLLHDCVISFDLEGREQTRTLDADGIIKLQVEEGQTIDITVDLPGTPGKDYYTRTQYSGENEIMLFPITSVRGIVKDSLDNIVGFADLKFACKPLPKIEHPLQADKFGTFSTITPIGKCKIYASYENALGFEEIILEHGELRDIEIKLDKTIVSFPTKKYTDYGILFLAAITIIAVITYFATRRKLKKERKHLRKKEAQVKEEKEEEKFAVKKKEEIKPTKRSEDIIATLNQKEKEIVNCLQLNRGEINQARIRHQTGIPRTSLSRIMISLENKNIIKVRKEGKAVKISLTDWFLGKE